ncbi:MAG TPA: nitrilase family protein [Flavobacteriales bacterium]|nr:nitrilase family protein [Flavobacteriales bacterium]
MSDNQINISLVQADLVWEDTEANLTKFDHLLERLPPDTEIVILPEMFSTGFTMNVQNLEKPVGQKAFHWLQKKAYSLQKIIVGSILTEANGKYYNRMYWMRPDGSFEYYDKRHLFHQGGEDKIMTAGDRKVFVSYKDFKFQLLICYDLRFPVWSKNRYDKATDTYDYDAIIYIANWPESRQQAYEHLLPARAIENQAYIIWVNRVGEDGHQIKHSGDSKIVSPMGQVLIEAKPYLESIISFTLDVTIVKQLRKKFNVGLDWDKFLIRDY